VCVCVCVFAWLLAIAAMETRKNRPDRRQQQCDKKHGTHRTMCLFIILQNTHDQIRTTRRVRLGHIVNVNHLDR